LSSARERREMNYEVFRSAVCEVFREEDKEWDVMYDWGEPPVDPVTGDAVGFEGEMEMSEDFVELEREKGGFYEFISVSVRELFHFYQEEGWDAAVMELEKHISRGKSSGSRNRGIDYTTRLNEEGKELYEKLRRVRSEEAARRQLPAYFIFTNRSLYEMCTGQPATAEEFRALYGVGEKKSQEYGELFLDAINEFTGGQKRPVGKLYTVKM